VRDFQRNQVNIEVMQLFIWTPYAFGYSYILRPTAQYPACRSSCSLLRPVHHAQLTTGPLEYKDL